MLLAISLFVKNVGGWLVLHWRWVVGVVAVLLVLVLFGLVFRSCGSSTKPMTEQERQEVKQAIAEQDEKKLKEKLAELEANEKVIDANVANAQAEKWAAIQESKDKWANANINELQAEFDRRMNQ